MSFLIVHPNFDELVNAVNLREKKNLPAAKDFHGVLILRGLGPSEATTHFRSKERTYCLMNRARSRSLPPSQKGSLVILATAALSLRASRFELDREGVEFKTGLGCLALTRCLQHSTEQEQQYHAENLKS